MRLALLLMLSIASTRAMGLFDSLIIDEVTASLDTQTEAGGADPTSTEFVESEYTHIVDAVVITVIAWVVVVGGSCYCKSMPFLLDMSTHH